MKKQLPNLLTNPIIHYNLDADRLTSQTLALGQGTLSDTGALVVCTGAFTGRSPNDKFVVKDEITVDTVDWNAYNKPIEERYFHALKTDLLAFLNNQKEVWVRDVYACASPAFRQGVRVINETPWCNLFVANMFIAPTVSELETFEPDWLIIQAPSFKATVEKHGTRQENFAVISFQHKTILIGGTGYTGEIKKGVFYVLNFLLPYEKNVLSMHCSANVGEQGDTAIFFGLSGTGKTTLSADPHRRLVGDDEHGWSNEEVFNFEGGCYAKAINLTQESEPEIYGAIRHGALVENVVFCPGTKQVDFSDISITENTRVSYPLSYIENALIPSIAGLPQNIFFLTCDAYGVFPPLSRLSPEQAMYYFISGYTAKIAGTEEGITEPQVTFSACFGAPFLPLHPGFYAKMLGEKIEKYKVNVWMVNTGWTGGSYGVGSRIKLSYTRAMINAVLDGKMDDAVYEPHAVFGVQVPHSVPDVPSELLNPINTWGDKRLYEQTALKLVQKFRTNFDCYASEVSPEILAAGPKS
ncbi:phosphoenolpyruvate carboxykinase (ATP) [Olivibacter sitiensis]|uniref:phosphoenolpyruvate carboxykinase (ATP) n=1 Tax=Olivibacter sitiensis TaxID=376470 RepID=UPI0004267EC5|nr:phosphoenolpyruvate carboxykinase (ATP) [Olivibacter sitiensis]